MDGLVILNGTLRNSLYMGMGSCRWGRLLSTTVSGPL